jgi:hypothetical protein
MMDEKVAAIDTILKTGSTAFFRLVIKMLQEEIQLRDSTLGSETRSAGGADNDSDRGDGAEEICQTEAEGGGASEDQVRGVEVGMGVINLEETSQEGWNTIDDSWEDFSHAEAQTRRSG